MALLIKGPLYLIQIVQDFIPGELKIFLSVANVIAQAIEDYPQYKDLSSAFYAHLNSTLSVLEVNQFHENYPIAIDSVKAKMREYEQKKKGAIKELFDKAKDFLMATNKLDDKRKQIEVFSQIRNIIPQVREYSILTDIKDHRAASFWVRYIGISVSKIRYDEFKNKIYDCPDCKDDIRLLENIRPDEVIAKSITKRHFDYVVTWLGGWNKFTNYIKTGNPFTREFFANASKIIQPPLTVKLDIQSDGEGSFTMSVVPTPMHWYSEDGKSSVLLSNIVYYKKGNAEYKAMIRPSQTIRFEFDNYEFHVFTAHKDLCLISNEWTGLKVEFNSNPKIKDIISFEPCSSCDKKETPTYNVEGLSQLKTWIPRKMIDLPVLPVKKPPIFRNTQNLLWSCTWQYSSDDLTEIVKNMRPTIIVSNAAYSLAEKLGFFFSPEILFWLWKRPDAIKNSLFIRAILGHQVSKGENSVEKVFVYHAVLKYNSKYNKCIKAGFSWFSWTPEYSEDEYNKAFAAFSRRVHEKVVAKTEKSCEEFSKELCSVVLEYLGNPDIMKACEVGAQSSIQGYYGPPSQMDMDNSQPGKIVVFRQCILGHLNTYVTQFPIKASIGSDQIKHEFEKDKAMRLISSDFYSAVNNYVKSQGGISLWTGCDPERCPPAVFMPGQIPFSLIEKILPLKPEDTINCCPTTADGLVEWMKVVPPKVPCIGITFNITICVKCPITLGNGFEFYALGDFCLMLKQNEKTKPIWVFNCCDGIATIEHYKYEHNKITVSTHTVDIFSRGYSDIAYTGYRIEVDKNDLVLRSCGTAPFCFRMHDVYPKPETGIFFEAANSSVKSVYVPESINGANIIGMHRI